MAISLFLLDIFLASRLILCKPRFTVKLPAFRCSFVTDLVWFVLPLIPGHSRACPELLKRDWQMLSNGLLKIVSGHSLHRPEAVRRSFVYLGPSSVVGSSFWDLRIKDIRMIVLVCPSIVHVS